MREVLKPAVVVSGGASALAVTRALASHGVPVVALYYEDADFAQFSSCVTEEMRVPHPEKSEGAFLAFLETYRHLWGGGLLIPCADAALSAISRNKRTLEVWYQVACADWDVTRMLLEKKNTAAIARAVGVPVPWTVMLRAESDLEASRPVIDFPCIVKPSTGHKYHDVFHVKMKRVDNFDQALAAYRESAAFGLDMMLQEFIPGPDSNGVNYNSYFLNGEPRVEFTARKVRNAPPVFGSPRVVVSQNVPEVTEHGRRMLRSIGFTGFSCAEFKQDPRNGVHKLMEINCRHNLSAALAVRCGIDFPWIQYQHLMKGHIPSAQTFETGVYWIELLRDLRHSFRHFSLERYPAKDYVRPYLHRHIFAVLDYEDPAPFVRRCVYTLQKAARAFTPVARFLGRKSPSAAAPSTVRPAASK